MVSMFKKNCYLFRNSCLIILLGAFVPLRKATVIVLSCQSDAHVCLSVAWKQLGFHWTHFYYITYFRIFRISVKIIQV